MQAKINRNGLRHGYDVEGGVLPSFESVGIQGFCTGASATRVTAWEVDLRSPALTRRYSFRSLTAAKAFALDYAATGDRAYAETRAAGGSLTDHLEGRGRPRAHKVIQH